MRNPGDSGLAFAQEFVHFSVLIINDEEADSIVLKLSLETGECELRINYFFSFFNRRGEY